MRILYKKVFASLVILTFGMSEMLYAVPVPQSASVVAVSGVVMDFSHQSILNDPSKLQVPFKNVTLKEIYKGSNGKLIIHIQDAHSNLSGQENLANALDYFMQHYKTHLVLVEGGGQDATLDTLRATASLEIWKRIARQLLYDGLIAGEEYLNLTTEHPMKIIGIENDDLYEENLRAYADMVDMRMKILLYLHKAQASLNRVKNKLFTRELLKYEESKEKSEKNQQGFKTKMDALFGLADNANVVVGALNYPETHKLRNIQTSEDSVDFERANSEQSNLFRQLSKKGASKKLKDILEAQKRAQNAQVSQFILLENIFRLAKENEVSIEPFTELKAYADYLKRFTELKLDVLLQELQVLEDEIYRELLPSVDAKKIRAIDRYLSLLYNAYNIQMSSNEFASFMVNEPDFPTKGWQAFVNRQLAQLGYFEDLVPYRPYLEEARQALQRFYNLVDERDYAFVENAKRSMAQEDQKVAFLIAGGYHTAHLTELLREQNFSYVVLTPVVTYETNRDQYENILLAGIRGGREALKQAEAVDKAEGEDSVRSLTPTRGIRAHTLLGNGNRWGEYDQDRKNAIRAYAGKVLFGQINRGFIRISSTTPAIGSYQDALSQLGIVPAFVSVNARDKSGARIPTPYNLTQEPLRGVVGLGERIVLDVDGEFDLHILNNFGQVHLLVINRENGEQFRFGNYPHGHASGITNIEKPDYRKKEIKPNQRGVLIPKKEGTYTIGPQGSDIVLYENSAISTLLDSGRLAIQITASGQVKIVDSGTSEDIKASDPLKVIYAKNEAGILQARRKLGELREKILAEEEAGQNQALEGDAGDTIDEFEPVQPAATLPGEIIMQARSAAGEVELSVGKESDGTLLFGRRGEDPTPFEPIDILEIRDGKAFEQKEKGIREVNLGSGLVITLEFSNVTGDGDGVTYDVSMTVSKGYELTFPANDIGLPDKVEAGQPIALPLLSGDVQTVDADEAPFEIDPGDSDQQGKQAGTRLTNSGDVKAQYVREAQGKPFSIVLGEKNKGVAIIVRRETGSQRLYLTVQQIDNGKTKRISQQGKKYFLDDISDMDRTGGFVEIGRSTFQDSTSGRQSHFLNVGNAMIPLDSEDLTRDHFAAKHADLHWDGANNFYVENRVDQGTYVFGAEEVRPVSPRELEDEVFGREHPRFARLRLTRKKSLLYARFAGLQDDMARRDTRADYGPYPGEGSDEATFDSNLGMFKKSNIDGIVSAQTLYINKGVSRNTLRVAIDKRGRVIGVGSGSSASDKYTVTSQDPSGTNFSHDQITSWASDGSGDVVEVQVNFVTNEDGQHRFSIAKADEGKLDVKQKRRLKFAFNGYEDGAGTRATTTVAYHQEKFKAVFSGFEVEVERTEDGMRFKLPPYTTYSGKTPDGQPVVAESGDWVSLAVGQEVVIGRLPRAHESFDTTIENYTQVRNPKGAPAEHVENYRNMSRYHANFISTQNAVLVGDLGSGNGNEVFIPSEGTVVFNKRGKRDLGSFIIRHNDGSTEPGLTALDLNARFADIVLDRAKENSLSLLESDEFKKAVKAAPLVGDDDYVYKRVHVLVNDATGEIHPALGDRDLALGEYSEAVGAAIQRGDFHKVALHVSPENGHIDERDEGIEHLDRLDSKKGKEDKPTATINFTAAIRNHNDRVNETEGLTAIIRLGSDEVRRGAEPNVDEIMNELFKMPEDESAEASFHASRNVFLDEDEEAVKLNTVPGNISRDRLTAFVQQNLAIDQTIEAYAIINIEGVAVGYVNQSGFPAQGLKKQGWYLAKVNITRLGEADDEFSIELQESAANDEFYRNQFDATEDSEHSEFLIGGLMQFRNSVAGLERERLKRIEAARPKTIEQEVVVESKVDPYELGQLDDLAIQSIQRSNVDMLTISTIEADANMTLPGVVSEAEADEVMAEIPMFAVVDGNGRVLATRRVRRQSISYSADEYTRIVDGVSQYELDYWVNDRDSAVHRIEVKFIRAQGKYAIEDWIYQEGTDVAIFALARNLDAIDMLSDEQSRQLNETGKLVSPTQKRISAGTAGTRARARQLLLLMNDVEKRRSILSAKRLDEKEFMQRRALESAIENTLWRFSRPIEDPSWSDVATQEVSNPVGHSVVIAFRRDLAQIIKDKLDLLMGPDIDADDIVRVVKVDEKDRLSDYEVMVMGRSVGRFIYRKRESGIAYEKDTKADQNTVQDILFGLDDFLRARLLELQIQTYVSQLSEGLFSTENSKLAAATANVARKHKVKEAFGRNERLTISILNGLLKDTGDIIDRLEETTSKVFDKTREADLKVKLGNILYPYLREDRIWLDTKIPVFESLRKMLSQLETGIFPGLDRKSVQERTPFALNLYNALIGFTQSLDEAMKEEQRVILRAAGTRNTRIRQFVLKAFEADYEETAAERRGQAEGERRPGIESSAERFGSVIASLKVDLRDTSDVLSEAANVDTVNRARERTRVALSTLLLAVKDRGVKVQRVKGTVLSDEQSIVVAVLLNEILVERGIELELPSQFMIQDVVAQLSALVGEDLGKDASDEMIAERFKTYGSLYESLAEFGTLFERALSDLHNGTLEEPADVGSVDSVTPSVDRPIAALSVVQPEEIAPDEEIRDLSLGKEIELLDLSEGQTTRLESILRQARTMIEEPGSYDAAQNISGDGLISGFGRLQAVSLSSGLNIDQPYKGDVFDEKQDIALANLLTRYLDLYLSDSGVDIEFDLDTTVNGVIVSFLKKQKSLLREDDRANHNRLRGLVRLALVKFTDDVYEALQKEIAQKKADVGATQPFWRSLIAGGRSRTAVQDAENLFKGTSSLIIVQMIKQHFTDDVVLSDQIYERARAQNSDVNATDILMDVVTETIEEYRSIDDNVELVAVENVMRAIAIADLIQNFEEDNDPDRVEELSVMNYETLRAMVMKQRSQTAGAKTTTANRFRDVFGIGPLVSGADATSAVVLADEITPGLTGAMPRITSNVPIYVAFRDGAQLVTGELSITANRQLQLFGRSLNLSGVSVGRFDPFAFEKVTPAGAIPARGSFSSGPVLSQLGIRSSLTENAGTSVVLADLGGLKTFEAVESVVFSNNNAAQDLKAAFARRLPSDAVRTLVIDLGSIEGSQFETDLRELEAFIRFLAGANIEIPVQVVGVQSAQVRQRLLQIAGAEQILLPGGDYGAGDQIHVATYQSVKTGLDVPTAGKQVGYEFILSVSDKQVPVGQFFVRNMFTSLVNAAFKSVNPHDVPGYARNNASQAKGYQYGGFGIYWQNSTSGNLILINEQDVNTYAVQGLLMQLEEALKSMDLIEATILIAT